MRVPLAVLRVSQKVFKVDALTETLMSGAEGEDEKTVPLQNKKSSKGKKSKKRSLPASEAETVHAFKPHDKNPAVAQLGKIMSASTVSVWPVQTPIVFFEKTKKGSVPWEPGKGAESVEQRDFLGTCNNCQVVGHTAI